MIYLKKLLIGIFLFLLSIYIYRENNVLEKSNYVYESKKIPEKFDGFKILQISDLHDKEFGKDNKNLINLIDEENPNIIIVTGDIFYSYTKKINHSLAFLKKISQKYPVYFVTGNHEYRDKNWEQRSVEVASYGVKIIDNKIEKIYIEDEYIQIYGLKDPAFYTKAIRYQRFEEELKKMQAQLNPDVIGILLSHRPDKLEIYSRNNVDLVFSGHAHGGQVRIFGKGLLSPSEGFFPRYTGGEYKEGNTTMILSRGLGRTIFTSRLFNRPDVVITVLKSEP